MTGLKGFIMGILATLALFIGVGFALPSNYHIERKVFIQVPPAEVFNQINTLPHWPNWAFAGYGLDSVPQLQFMGPADGPGAIYTWQDSQGGGRMEIIASELPKSVQLQLLAQEGTFTAQINFRLEAHTGGTFVYWSEDGDVGMRLFTRFYMATGGLEKAIGERYHAGLHALKTYCESRKW